MKEKIRHIKGAYIADNATVIGDVQMGEGASIWYGTVARGDDGAIIIGKGSNVQDNCIIHCHPGAATVLGENVTVGHGVILHGCTVGDNTVVGMGSILMEGAQVGKDCMIGAGSLVTGKTKIPDGHLAMGSPAKVIRPLRDEEIASNRASGEFYQGKAKEHFG